MPDQLRVYSLWCTQRRYFLIRFRLAMRLATDLPPAKSPSLPECNCFIWYFTMCMLCALRWAEVLSADAFNAFEEAGLEDEDAVRSTGRRFRDTVLVRC